MITVLEPHDFLAKAETLPVVDVRSEGEFMHAHIPGAINIPLFNNEERAKVGTTYKQTGKEEAIELGLEIAGPKLAGFVKQAKALAKSKEILVHCWRGGMRSGSFAWLLQTAGMNVYTLSGGYKGYRASVHALFSQAFNFVLLGGKTGAGKTRILDELSLRAEQVIDLERLCDHKGSAFGALGQKAQCATEQFENNLFEIIKGFDSSKRIWVENESKNLGKIFIPNAIWDQMKAAPLYFVDVEKTIRIENLVKEYACFPKVHLAEAILRIRKRLGGLNFNLAMEALEQNNFATVADLCLLYYDKAYLTGLSQRNKETIKRIEAGNKSVMELVDILIQK